MSSFVKANILLPKTDSMERWAVIACDQFVSQPAYWAAVRKFVGDAPSALHLILPESELEGDCTQSIAAIHQAMLHYLQSGVFREYPDCFIYTERTLENGSVRKGVVGALDLTHYDYSPLSDVPVHATEETVQERVPPRMAIRRNAAVELPHVLLLCDDTQLVLIDSLSAKRDTLPLLYDFHLMADGGRVRGWLVAGQDADVFAAQVARYEASMKEKFGENAVMYAVGDGNHSVAAAKACYLENTACQAARYALVELENIHDEAQVFEPIHRIVKDTDCQALIEAMDKALSCKGGRPVTWFAGTACGTMEIAVPAGQLAVGVVQDFLDHYVAENPGVIDYVHGEDAVRELAEAPNTLGLLLPPVDKNAFFKTIIVGGTLPRKTFSMGHAREKRYYLEARKIKDN